MYILHNGIGSPGRKIIHPNQLTRDVRYPQVWIFSEGGKDSRGIYNMRKIYPHACCMCNGGQYNLYSLFTFNSFVTERQTHQQLYISKLSEFKELNLIEKICLLSQNIILGNMCECGQYQKWTWYTDFYHYVPILKEKFHLWICFSRTWMIRC